MNGLILKTNYPQAWLFIKQTQKLPLEIPTGTRIMNDLNT